VSKFHSVETILEAYNAGERIFGESRVQELSKKQPQLPCDIQWHFIGHLQSNKIKYIAPFVSMIHSADSFELLCEINRHALKCGRIINVLLQIHIAGEETKFGFHAAEIPDFLKTGAWKKLENIKICGLMGMASFTADAATVTAEFNTLSLLFDTLKKEYFSADTDFCELSMGMTGDFPLAIGAGSTMVRIGSAIFGGRT
jgi:pyridoxal phosphate enzyme (YggS family)